MKVHVKNLLVNRSELTRKYKIAGSPVLQMATHVPVVDDCPRPSFETSAYNLIRLASESKGNYYAYASLDNLCNDIKQNGVRESVTGWDLGDGVYELYGGHHRAIMAHFAGIETIDLTLKPLSLTDTVLGRGAKTVKAFYDKVPQSESLRAGHSYNPCPGFVSIRPTAELRLQMIYKAIIDCSGDTLIDLGCNDGYFGTALSLHDFDVTFVDRSQAYLDVVAVKMTVIGKKCNIYHADIDGFFSDHKYMSASVILYTDVFYHMVVEKGKQAAIDQLRQVINRTSERLIFAPGRWDKLEKHGVTQKLVYDELAKRAKRIRYLGCDKDKNYGREIYCVEL